MNDKINSLFERINDFLVRWPGVIPLVGLALILLNFALQLYPGQGFWIVDVNFFLHLGLLISVTGLLLVNVYRS